MTEWRRGGELGLFAQSRGISAQERRIQCNQQYLRLLLRLGEECGERFAGLGCVAEADKVVPLGIKSIEV